jgi:hypothetical protein
MSKIAVRSKDQATSTAIIRLEGIISKLERTIETQNKRINNLITKNSLTE